MDPKELIPLRPLTHLMDEGTQNQFMRHINEGYRTWHLREQKTEMVLKQLKSYNYRLFAEKLENRIAQLKQMTLGQPPEEDKTEESFREKGVVDMFEQCEAAMERLGKFAPKRSKQSLDAKTSGELECLRWSYTFEGLEYSKLSDGLKTAIGSQIAEAIFECIRKLPPKASMPTAAIESKLDPVISYSKDHIIVDLSAGSIVADVAVVGESIEEHLMPMDEEFVNDLKMHVLEKLQHVIAKSEPPIDLKSSDIQVSWSTTPVVAEKVPDRLLQKYHERRGARLEIEEQEAQKEFFKTMHDLDAKILDVLDEKVEAQIKLKKHEEELLPQWKERKQAMELWTKRYSALTGVRSGMEVFLKRHDMYKEEAASSANDAIEEQSARPGKDVAFPEVENTGGADNRIEADEDREPETEGHAQAQSLCNLSEILQAPASEDREEILKREHPGSAGHPLDCRPCHFQGGLCWKGLSCSFCHICPKPKRKSKHQRDVDKRRQERYKQVKEDLGAQCLDELTAIDEGRRQIMAYSEQLKSVVKDAYASGMADRIQDANQMVAQMKATVESYQKEIPEALLNGDEDGEESGSDRWEVIAQQDREESQIAADASATEEAMMANAVASSSSAAGSRQRGGGAKKASQQRLYGGGGGWMAPPAYGFPAGGHAEASGYSKMPQQMAQNMYGGWQNYSQWMPPGASWDAGGNMGYMAGMDPWMQREATHAGGREYYSEQLGMASEAGGLDGRWDGASAETGAGVLPPQDLQ